MRPSLLALRRQPDRPRDATGASRGRCCAPGSTGRARPCSSLDDLRAQWIAGRAGRGDRVLPRAGAGGQTAPIDALIAALQARGLNPLPIFVASLKEQVGGRPDRALLADDAAGRDRSTHRLRDLAARRGAGGDAVRRGGCSGAAGGAAPAAAERLARRHARPRPARPRDERRAARGRRPHPHPRRLVQGGRRATTTRPNATSSSRSRSRTASPSSPISAAPGCGCAASRPPSAASRIVLANYPNRDGRIGNGVGLDTPAGVVEALQRDAAMPATRSATCPANGDALIARLLDGPTNAPAHASAPAASPCRCADYRELLRGTARSRARQVAQRWGAPERDPLRRRRRVPPAADPASATSSSASSRRAATTSTRPRPITTRTWCRRTATSPSTSGCATASASHAVVHLGKHGNLEWLPGKALALSASLLSRGGARAAAASLSLHRQRSGRGHAGQAARRRGDRRPPDAAADPRRELRPAARARGAGRRVLRGGAARPAPAAATCASASSTCARGARPRPRTAASPRTTTPTPRCASSTPSLRAEGAADPRRAARLRPLARGRPADRPAGGARPRCRAARARAATPRCSARWPPISALGFDPLDCRPGRAVDRPAAGGAGGARRRPGAPPATRSSGWSCWR